MQNLITKNDIANEIKMKKVLYKQAFIVVEGATDSRFYKKFIDKDKCSIIPAHNKSNVIGVIELLQDQSGIIGIVDSDYDNIENQNKDFYNLFKTDMHDIETMIINSPALEDFLCEYVDENKLDIFLKNKQKEDLRQILIENTLFIGYTKWASLKNDLCLKFKGLEYKKFFTNTLSFLKTRFLKELINNSDNYNGDIIKITQNVDELKDNSYDPWQICSGHDMSNVLLIGLHRIFGLYTAKSLDNKGKLEGSLRMCYESNYFMETSLYKKMKEWEKNNSFTIFNKNKFENYEVSSYVG